MRKEVCLSMTLEEYKVYYLKFVNCLLGIREQELGVMDLTEEEKQSYFNDSLGVKLLLMVAFIESNFLSKSQMKSLRNFREVEGIPSSINQKMLSCFIYLRDAIAHNPKVELLSPGSNTDAFVEAVNEHEFNLAKIEGSVIQIDNRAINRLHLMVKEFYKSRMNAES